MSYLLLCLLFLPVNCFVLKSNIDTLSKSKLNADNEPTRSNFKNMFRFSRTAGAINTAYNVASLSSSYESLSDKVKTYITRSDEIINPRYYTQKISHSGEEWTLTKLIDKIDNDRLNGISINKEGLYALAIDKINHTNVGSADIHYISLIPTYTNTLIENILSHKIPLDFI